MADEVLNPTTPANSSSPSLGASFMRRMQAAILNALNKDHYIGNANVGTGEYDDTDLGEHSKITLREASADPSTASNKGFLYTKDVNGVTELFYRDSSGDITQLTNDGYLGGDNKLILTSDTSAGNAQASVILSNKSTDAPSSFSHYSDIQFLGKLSAIIAKITGSHYGLGADDKGQIQLTVNDGSAGEKVFLLTPDTVDAGTRLISNVADPVSNQDAATKKYVDEVAASAVSTNGSGKLTTTDTAILTISSLTCHGLRCIVMVNGGYNIGVRKTVTLTVKTKNLTLNTETVVGTYTFGGNNAYDDDYSSSRPDAYSFSISEIIAAANINSGAQSFTVYAKVNEEHAIGSYFGHCSMTVFEVR